jgi:hypothetical protein
VPGVVRDRLQIIYKDFLWKRKLDLSEESLKLLATGRIGRFIQSQKQEYYLVTNK